VPPPQILYVADDFGLSSEVNESILHAHNKGALTSAALMLGQEGTEEAVSLAKEYPDLELGLHFHFCDSKPTTRKSWPWGRTPASLGSRLGFQPRSLALIEEEIDHQWTLFTATGRNPAFINVHHHLHAHPWISKRIGDYLIKKNFRGWVRGGVPHFFSPVSPIKQKIARYLSGQIQKKISLPSPHSLWGIDRTFQMNPQEIRPLIATLTEGIHEFIFHPRTLRDPETQCLIQLKQSL